MILTLPDAAPQLTLALYQPDIAQNAGTLLRMCACLGVEAALIGPAGFAWGDRSLRRAGMDYLDYVTLSRHACFEDFDVWRRAQRPPRRLVLLTTKSPLSYLDARFRAGDVLMVGRRIGWRSGGSRRQGRSRGVDRHEGGNALAQRRHRRGDGAGRGAASAARRVIAYLHSCCTRASASERPLSE